MRDYKKLYEIVEYCKAFQSQFFEYLTDGIVGGDCPLKPANEMEDT